MMVKDSGPGLRTGTDASIVGGLAEATASARESDEKTAEDEGKTSKVLAPPTRQVPEKNRTPQQPGEGIGLSIVKRLCELLDACLEVASSAATGTTFRIVLPKHYAAG
jgi:light-regulated signal transduction histidine kinase (bacteriophytochrome)